MNDIPKTGLIIFPPERMLPDYPFHVWLAGCAALTKGFIWLCQQNLTPAVFLFPLMILFGVGVWNFRSWAYWGLLFTAIFELMLYLFFPFYVLNDMHSGFKLGFYTSLFNLLVGPFGDGIIIVSLIASYKYRDNAPANIAAKKGKASC